MQAENSNQVIRTPGDAALDELCRALAEQAAELDRTGGWPAHQLYLCGRYGVFQWFLPAAWGGQDWDEPAIVRGYLRLSAACLTTTFVITQRTGACRRIAASGDDELKRELLPDLASGKTFATVGISHLTTSRRHLAKPVLAARPLDGGFVLEGFSPWVTGGPHAQHVVTGATLEDGRQILVALPMDAPGVEAGAPEQLVGLTASHTGAVHCREVFVENRWLLAGPEHDVMRQGRGANTGGLQTSTLAIGLAGAAIGYLREEAERRGELESAADRLAEEHERLEADLFAVADGRDVCSLEQLRAAANSLALRSTQSALTAAKGMGYVVGHPAGRWCREALFFLVWSCPQPVVAANLCELANLEG